MEHDALEYLFVQYARLVAQLVRVDVNTLQSSHDTSEEPDLISLRYQMLFSWIVPVSASADVPLWRMLHDFYSYDLDAFAAAVMAGFCVSPTDPLEHLAEFTRLVFERIIPCPKISKNACYPVTILQKLVTSALERCSLRGAGTDLALELWHQTSCGAAGICRQIDQQLQVIIEKQATLPRDFIKDLYIILSVLFVELAQADPTIGRALFREKGGKLDEVDVAELPQLVSRAWKFSLLKKCIVAGRMEVRVQALDAMTTDLVDVYKQYTSTRYDHPVMQYLANFILDNELVEYLVGVDSHMQLVERSANVAGFLIVTHKYTSRESDAIWHVVRTNQDPRFIAAVLRMIKGFFGVADYPLVLYLCRKLTELPLSSFDGAMIEYAGALLLNIREKFRTMEIPKLDMPPYELCIRLIRQATASPSDQSHDLSSVSQFALRELQELLVWGPSADDRKVIYLECIRDITAKNPYSTGSICVINALQQQIHAIRDLGVDLETLTSEMDLTRLVIEETAHTLQLERSKTPLPNNEIILTSRLDLLGRIIAKVPSTINEQLGEQLWSCLAENKSLTQSQRDLGWSMLCGVTARLRSRNSFVDQCIRTHLPRLHPRYFSPGVLSMAQQVIQYEHRMVPQRPPSEHEIIQITGSDLVWRIILTAPSHTIEEQAIQYLVSQYLDAPIIRNAPKSAVEATHLALVDKCVRQLTGAASRLKAFSDGTTSGEDEPMVIVASDAEVKAEELCFIRSLMLLQEILRGMRERPHYSPSPPKVTDPPQAPGTSQGSRLVRVRYQAFPSPNGQPTMKEFETSDLEKCEVLKKRLSRATGFRYFRTFSGGREIDLDKHSSATLRGMQIGAHALMISKTPKAPTEVSESHSREGLTAVEIELLKHFDALYDLLGLEEKLAAQVRRRRREGLGYFKANASL